MKTLRAILLGLVVAALVAASFAVVALNTRPSATPIVKIADGPTTTLTPHINGGNSGGC